MASHLADVSELRLNRPERMIAPSYEAASSRNPTRSAAPSPTMDRRSEPHERRPVRRSAEGAEVEGGAPRQNGVSVNAFPAR